MKNLFNNIYFFVLFLFFNAVGYAQLYPVQLTPVFNSPYSVKISDYATSMDTKMQLLINPTDISISQRRVRLKLYIQGNGLNIQTSDYAQEQRPIYINGGELQTLTNVDIASLFRLENLQGMTPAQYANPLPEGMYNFCFEMYDFVTNQKISQKSCANLYLILNDPPLLNTPQKNEQIASTEFPNILFTWTPRQINATNISYKFELKQLLDPTLDPQIGFQMSPTLYEETLYGTAVLYNLSMPILTPGLRYAWRVRAISTTGLSENSVFKNDGYSEIYSFKYTASCAAPTFLLSEAQSSKSVKITWEGIPEHTRYQVQYKKQDVRNAQWFSSNSLNRQSLITNLEPGVTYEFRVGSSCDPAEDGVQSFTYSNTSTFTTPTESNGIPAYNCGIVPQINIQNQKPLTNLIQSETFKAGDFPVTILELQGENSPYSGRGYIIVPYLADTKIAVEFKDIVINTDYQLISGVVETSYNPQWGNVVDVKELIVDLLDSITDLINKKEDLLNDNKGGIKNQEEFNEKWIAYEKELKEKFDLLFNSSDLPQSVKDDIAKVAGNTFTASIENSIPKVTEFESKIEESKAQKDLINVINETNKLFEELVAFLDLETVIKCKKCSEEKKVAKPQIDKLGTSTISFSPYNKERFICVLGNLINGEFKFKKIESKQANTLDAKLLESTKKAFNTQKETFLTVVHSDNQLVECAVKYPSEEICSAGTKVLEKTEKEIAEEVKLCYTDNKVNFILPALAESARSNQSVEFFYNNEVYRFYNNKVEKVEKPLTDDQINNGDWTEGQDVKIRYAINSKGVIEYKALGFRKNLPIVNGKTADLKEMADHIKKQGNIFFNAANANTPTKTPKQAGLKLNEDKEVYADGKKMEIDENEYVYKIGYEALGLVTSLIKTGKIEKKTYSDYPEEKAIIKAPGLVTGSVEVVATKVTSLTSIGTLVYDLSVDKKARDKAFNDFVGIKDQVGSDPKIFVPTLGKVVLSMSTGLSEEEWQQLTKNTDGGIKSHSTTLAVENAVITVFASSDLIAKLPYVSEKLAENIKKVLTAANTLNNISDLADNNVYSKDIPADIPITIPHAVSKDLYGGNCKVYVIWKVAPNSDVSVAKYGMTCTDDYDENCNMRPERQCVKFEKENNPENYKFYYGWVITGISKEMTHAVEKSLTAAYVISNGGNMPSHHYLPCFVRDKQWDEDMEGRKVTEERRLRAIKWLKDMLIQYGK